MGYENSIYQPSCYKQYGTRPLVSAQIITGIKSPSEWDLYSTGCVRRVDNFKSQQRRDSMWDIAGESPILYEEWLYGLRHSQRYVLLS